MPEITVTGSRILRRDDSSDSPLLTITNEDLTSTSAISIDQQLAKLPQFVPGQNQISDSGATQATPTDSPGIATANLRGLGANRTLVLIDGRRVQPANASLVVDLNTIPTLAIDNVEIITGGAGSTYGADAVAGVVNFKLKRNYEGVSADAQYGITQQGDGGEYKFSTLMGANFSDNRGNVMVGLSYAKRRPAYVKNRKFFTEAWTDPLTTGGTATSGFGGYAGVNNQAALDSVFGAKGYSAGDVGTRTNLYFNTGPTTADATLFTILPGAVSGDPAVGYTGSYYPRYKLLSNGTLSTNTNEGYLSLPLETYSAFLSGHYDFTDNIEFYVQGSFNQKKTRTQAGTYVNSFNQWAVTIPYDSATNGVASGHPVPSELATILNARSTPDAPWTLYKEMDYLGLVTLNTTTYTYELTAGFRGNLGIKDWTYDVFGTHGRTDQNAVYSGYADWTNYQALINEPNYGAGADYNNGRLGRLAHCTSGLNPFVNTAVSQDCIDIVKADINTGTSLTQDTVELNFQGSVTPLPAGDMRFALGADYRSNGFHYTPDKGISTSNITSFTLGLFDTTETQGSVKTKELYGELLIPVVRDLPLVKSLELNAGYRYSDYNNIGGVSTWKLTGDWEAADWIKFRGGYQLANRAPNVAELYQPPVFVIVGWPDHDPCSILTRAPYGNVASNPNRAQVQALCTALNGGNTTIDNTYTGNLPFYFPLGRDLQQGNANLKSEKAHTWTFGTVITSPFEDPALQNLRLSVDFYRINITGAIAPASTQLVYQECFNGLGNNPTYDPNFDYCQRILRQPNGYWIATIAAFENLGKISTTGIDTQLDWSTEAPNLFGDEPARVFTSIFFNYLASYKVQNNAGGPTFDYAGSAGADSSTPPYGSQFRWKLNTTVGYAFSGAMVSVNWRHFPGTKYYSHVTNPTATELKVPAYNIFDLSARWQINDMYALRFGMENVFNKQPPRVGVIPGVNAAAGTTDVAYDQLGRRFYFGVGANF